MLSTTWSAHNWSSPMATEADARARAAAELKKLLLRVASTSSFVLDVTSGPSEVYGLWECLPGLLKECDIGEDSTALLTSLLDAGAVNTFVGLMLDFPSVSCSEPPNPWTMSSDVSGQKPP